MFLNCHCFSAASRRSHRVQCWKNLNCFSWKCFLEFIKNICAHRPQVLRSKFSLSRKLLAAICCKKHSTTGHFGWPMAMPSILLLFQYQFFSRRTTNFWRARRKNESDESIEMTNLKLRQQPGINPGTAEPTTCWKNTQDLRSHALTSGDTEHTALTSTQYDFVSSFISLWCIAHHQSRTSL